MTSLYYSTVVSAVDNRPKRVKCTWPELVKRLRRPEVRGKFKLKKYLELPRKEAAAQKGGPAWIGGTFKKGGKRNDEDLDKLYFFVGDVDNKAGRPITLADLENKLRGLEAVIHTTYSHSRSVPKFRFVVPLAQPVDRNRYGAVFAHFNNTCGGSLDPKGKTPSQLYYWPSCPPDAKPLFKFSRLNGGKYFDPTTLGDTPVEERKEVSVDLPEELPEIDLEKIELSDRVKELIRLGRDPSNRYTSRSEMIFAVVIALMSRGCSDAEIAGICLDPRYGISEKVLENKRPRKYMVTTLKKARGVKFVGDKATVEAIVAEMNAKHAVVGIGGRAFILTEADDPVLKRKDVLLGFERDLKLTYGNRRIMINEKATSIADVWLSHEARRQYDRIIFSPESDVPGCYNLWRGFSVEPKKGRCEKFLSHIRDNISGGDSEVHKYIIAFMADAVQNPTRLPGVTLVMRGGEGTGKGVFATEFGRLFGQHFVHVSSSHHLVGRFNAHLKDALLVFADEAFYAGDKSAQGVLNAIVSEPTRMLEHKGKDSITVPNFTRLIMASNHDWVVPAGPVARRFFVVDVSADQQQNVEYFTAIRREMDKGGREALLHYLLNVDISGIELRSFPRTEALVDQQIMSMGAEQKFWVDRLRRGELLNRAGKWADRVKCSTLYDQFIEFAQKSGFGRRSGETEFGMALLKLCPEMERKRKRTPENFEVRAYYYCFPELKRCRELFEQHMKTQINWRL